MILYRFADNMTACITHKRYGRLYALTMQRVWIGAIRRLMAEQGYRSDSAFCDAKGIRKNTLSDALNEKKETQPRIGTFVEIAEALGVPLWSLFCTSREYALFTEHAAAAEATEKQMAQTEKLVAAVMEKMTPLVRTAVVEGLGGQLVGHSANELPARPVPIQKSPHKRKTGQ